MTICATCHQAKEDHYSIDGGANGSGPTLSSGGTIISCPFKCYVCGMHGSDCNCA